MVAWSAAGTRDVVGRMAPMTRRSATPLTATTITSMIAATPATIATDAIVARAVITEILLTRW